MSDSDYLKARRADFDFRLYGPVDLPPAITHAASTLSLFYEYLGQSATKRAILGTAGKDRKKVQLAINDIMSVESEKLLRQLVTKAPALAVVVSCAREVMDPSVLPESAIPSPVCIAACLEAYHAWVKACSQR